MGDKLKKCVYYSETCPDGPVTKHTPGPDTPTPTPDPDTRTPPDTPSPTPDADTRTPPHTPSPTPDADTRTPPHTTHKPTPDPDPRPDPCDPCIKNCDGKPAEKQRYQSCNGCSVYATCE